MSGEESHRLRAALALVGFDPGEGTSLRELVVRAARVIADNADEIKAQRNRATSRALLPPRDEANPDPWALSARVMMYYLTREQWTGPFLIVDREVNADGTVRSVMVKGQSLRFHLGSLPYGTAGGGRTLFVIPEATDRDEALEWFGPQRSFRGAYKTYGLRMHLPGSPSVIVRARSKKEVNYLLAKNGLSGYSAADLTDFVSETWNDAAVAAAEAQPDTVLVQVGTSLEPKYISYREFVKLVPV